MRIFSAVFSIFLSISSLANVDPYFSEEVYTSVPDTFRTMLKKDFQSIVLKPKARKAPGVVISKVIFQGFSEVELRKKLQKSSQKGKTSIDQLEGADLDAGVTRHRLAPLHIAAALRDQEAIDFLLSLGADVNIQDAHGWTPLHFAALHKDDAFFNRLADRGAITHILNNFHGTPYHIWDLTRPTPQEKVKIRIWSEEEGRVVTQSGEDFYAETGAHFSHKVVAKPEVLLGQWKAGKAILSMDKLMPNSQATFQFSDPNHIHKDPDLYLKRINDNLGYGVFADKEFDAGETLSVYQGEQHLRRPSDTSSEYLMQGKLDGEHIRGYGSMALDGFPNASFLPVSETDGLKDKMLLVAIRPIAPNDPIVVDYRTHDIKLSTHTELNPEALVAFEEQLTAKMIREFGELNQKVLDEMSTDAAYNGFNYILNTPTAWLHLLLSSDKGQKLADKIRRTSMCLYISPNCKAFYQYFVSSVYLFSNLRGDTKDAFRDFFMERAEEGYVQFIFTLIQILNNDPQYQDAQNLPYSDAKKFLGFMWQELLNNTCQNKEVDKRVQPVCDAVGK